MVLPIPISNWIYRWGSLTLAIAGVLVTVTMAYANLEARMGNVENGARQELEGYKVIIGSFGERMGRMEQALARMEGRMEVDSVHKYSR